MTSDKKSAIARMLNDSGLKSTPQRIAVYEVMRSLGHASADDICNRMRSDGRRCTVATVYNVLDSFVEKGIVARRFSCNNRMYFDVTTTPHCHLYDERTDTMVDYDDPELNAIVNDYIRTKSIEGYDLTGVDIQIIGHKKDK